MAYTTEEGQRQVLDALSQATHEIDCALAALSEAHEQLDEQSADRLERQLFRPAQRAYALLSRTRADFASRSSLQVAELEAPARGAPAHGVKGFLDETIETIESADTTLADLQDSMLPVEVGDAQLRGGISSVRELIGEVAPAGRAMLRTFGR